MALKLTMFSDFICPFCYIGFEVVRKLKPEFDLEIEWRGFQIHPEWPAEGMPASAYRSMDAAYTAGSVGAYREHGEGGRVLDETAGTADEFAARAGSGGIRQGCGGWRGLRGTGLSRIFPGRAEYRRRRACWARSRVKSGWRTMS